MKQICIFLILFLTFGTSSLVAQTPVNVHYIDLGSLLIYVLPFYAVTLLGLGLFIHKLMRPSFPSRWMYICSIIGILGAGLIAHEFKEIRRTQLPAAQNPNINMTNIAPELQERIIEREKSDAAETIANYWVVAIPNFILLGFGLGLDWKNRKDGLS